jgi:hypothetical protein
LRLCLSSKAHNSVQKLPARHPKRHYTSLKGHLTTKRLLTSGVLIQTNGKIVCLFWMFSVKKCGIFGNEIHYGDDSLL